MSLIRLVLGFLIRGVPRAVPGRVGHGKVASITPFDLRRFFAVGQFAVRIFFSFG